MPASSVRLGPSGELVVVRCSPPEDPERLARTAANMRAAAGIAVEVLDVDDGPPLVVTLAYAGRVPDAPMPGAAAGALGAKVAAALCDLAAMGLEHRAIELDHVLVDAAGSVRLCGFGECAPGDGTTDVRALGRLLDALVDPADRSAEANAVRAVVARTSATDTPTAAAIAASLASIGAAPRVRLPTREPATSSRRWPDRRRLATTAAAVALVAVVAIAAVVWSGSDDRAMSRHAAPASTSSTTSTSTSTTAVEARRVWPATPITIEGAGATWSLGRDGDAVVVGTWGCRSTIATPALVRADGTVWIFVEWKDDAPATYVTTIDDEIVDVRVDRTDGCDDLVVTTASGTVRPLA